MKGRGKSDAIAMQFSGNKKCPSFEGLRKESEGNERRTLRE